MKGRSEMAVEDKVAPEEKAQGAAAGTAPKSKAHKGEGPVKESLYADYHKIHPRHVTGKFRNIKNFLNIFLLAIYFAGPWFRWERPGAAPDQMILMDLSGQRGYFMGIEIWPQEVYYLTGLLILGAVGLFFFTALLGRVWCGFTCIQTVFTDVFVTVERWLEGDRNARIKMDRGPWTVNKFVRKSIKITIWLLISLATGFGWAAYFNDAPQLVVDLLHLNAGWGVYTTILLVGGFTFVLAGWAREQVCIYMCPWPRFQAAMFDEDSLIVTYEKWRGEPRGFAKKDTSFETRGHCVDCTLCVQVCPTGTDIRDGSQLSCIGCGLCIDACDAVMDRFNLPRGLITYDSNNRQIARAKGEPIPHNFVRSRTVIYAVLLVVVTAVMAWSLSSRSRLEVNVLHERSPLFVALSDGSLRNGYTFKVLNMGSLPQTYRLKLSGVEGASLRVVGLMEEDRTEVDLPVKGDSVGTFRVYVTAKPQVLKGKATDLIFVLTNAETGEVKEHKSLFAGPEK
ncbi:cytochrome c oxidase accessory protein CcoG [Novispirillum itersonii]|uniref:cytochrome c oxidase accessory protein CcoG n=1 Tax=Novispirillum itersonii TaxID=189 RepID=UPI001FDF7FED|nr:cytochrome c oxidase accessory protein CcoG [Novispirillum itersonii]